MIKRKLIVALNSHSLMLTISKENYTQKLIFTNPEIYDLKFQFSASEFVFGQVWTDK